MEDDVATPRRRRSDDTDEIELPPGIAPLSPVAEILRLRSNVHRLRDDLQGVVGVMELLRQEMHTLREGVNRIYTWVQWGVLLVLGAVILAGLGLVLRPVVPTASTLKLPAAAATVTVTPTP